jgi:UDP-N-acetylglucosamine acyltransferase
MSHSHSIHPWASVDPGAELGQNVTIGPFAVIGKNVRIDADCRIEAHAVIEGPTVIGRGNRVYSGAKLGFDPQDLKFAGEETRLEIGDGNHFRENTTVHRGTGKGGGLTKIGNDNLFMVGTHIAHDCMVGSRTIFANNGTLAGHVEVGDDAVIGAFSSVHQFCRVGRYAYIGGYSVLTQDVLPFVKTVGAKPACYGLNRIGLERKGFEAETLRRLEKAYRILVRSKLTLKHALEQLEGELAEDPHVAYLIEFVRGSTRGVVREVPSGGSRGA